MLTLVAFAIGATAWASVAAAHRRWIAAQVLDALGEPVPMGLQPGSAVVIQDLDDLRLVGDLSRAVGLEGSVTLGRGEVDGSEVVCVRWHPRLAPELSRLHVALGGLAPTVLISVPRWSASDLAGALGVLSEWGYRVRRVERSGPFRRNDREWLVATSDRRIGLERQREHAADAGGTRGSGSSAF